MTDRTKLLVHLRRLSDLLGNAFRYGPDGTLTGKFEAEHPDFVHYSCAFYLAGCLAFLEGEEGGYSWNKASQSDSSFDSFASRYPEPPKKSYRSRGITKGSLNALACIRNGVIHNDGDLTRNQNRSCVQMVTAANIPGVKINGDLVRLEAEFLEFVRIATLAVRNFYGDF